MNRFRISLFVVLFTCISSCKTSTDCDKLPTQFTSYEEALTTIESSKYLHKEEVNTSKSSWIRGASFYSCDGTIGYFVLKTDKKEYLYSNMPYRVWSDFRNAESFGTYYNENIKNRYTFHLNK